jgi:3-phenylpropionate/cinnamic acid dioxygenase small subunit
VRELTFRAGQFLIRESELLDERRFEEWLALYEPDAWYWAPVLPEASERGLALAHFDEDHTQMEARVRRLRQPTAYSEHPPARTCRLVGSVRIVDESQTGELTVRSALVVHEYRNRVTGDTRRTYAATVRHGLRPRGEDFGIGWKRVDLVDSECGFHVASVPL